MDNDWRSDVDPMIKDYLELLISESSRQRHAYRNAKNTANAQLWCAIAILSKQVFDLNLKVKFLERALMDLAPKKPKKSGHDDGIDPSEALKDVLKRL